MRGDRADIARTTMFRVWAGGALVGAFVGLTSALSATLTVHSVAHGVLGVLVSALLGFVVAVPIGIVLAALNRPAPIPDHCGKCGYSLAGLEGNTCPECGAGFRRVRRTRCPKCGYSLDSLTSGVCPECGKPFDPDVRLGL